ncbi:MAG: TetR/AcrR family transcriptional regulator [Reyranellaceae bacterium]
MTQSEPVLRLVEAVRVLLEEGGIAALRLPRLAQQAGLDLATTHRLAPTPLAALRLALDHIDEQVLAGGDSDADEPARERLFDVMMRRYDALVPWRGALRSLMRSPPFDPLLALGLGWNVERSMATMLEVAGIGSGGLAGAVRVRGLCLIHADVLRNFLDDDSEDLSATMKALDTRLRQAAPLASLLGGLERLPRTAAKSSVSPMHENRSEASSISSDAIH